MNARLSHMCLAICMALTLNALSSCNGPATESDEEIFMQKNEICMVVGTQVYISPSLSATGVLQTSYNSAKHIYRAGIPVSKVDTSGVVETKVEVVENSFTLVLSAAPGQEGSSVDGTLYLVSDQLRSGSQTYSDASFNVKRVESDKVWLWCADQHVGAVIQVL